jgi:hypothetical protein
MKRHRPVIARASEESGHASSWRVWVFIVGLALDGILPAFASGHAGDNPVRLAVFGAFAALVIAWVCVALHELGHAVASSLIGGRVRQVRIGAGPQLRTRQAFGAEVVLRVLPTDGCTMCEPPTGTALRARLIVRAGAGIFVNAALIGVALTMLSGYWALMILLVNGYMLVSNVLPHTTPIAEGALPSDGLALLRLLRAPAPAAHLAAQALPTPMSRPSGFGPAGASAPDPTPPRLGGAATTITAPDEANGGEQVERFTDLFDPRARRVIVLAQEEARLLNHERTGAEHLLIGLHHEREGIPARMLASRGISYERLRASLADIKRPERWKRLIGRGRPPATGPLRLTPQAKQVLVRSHQESLALGHNLIGPEHLLLGLLQETDGIVVELLARLGINRLELRAEALEILEHRDTNGVRPTGPS